MQTNALLPIDANKRFFSRLTGYFKQDYAGRYFSVILAELARIEPDAFLQILDHVKLELPAEYRDALRLGGLSIDVEWSFPHKRRLADLALYLEPKKPIFLAEIKVEDELRKGQLKDYLEFVSRGTTVKARHPCFLLITRYPLSVKDADTFNKAIKIGMPVAHLQAGKLHHILANRGSTITRMLREYLEDVGMSYQAIDLKREHSSIIHLCSRMINIENAKFGRIASHSSIQPIPSLMMRFLGNAEVLSTWIYSANRKLFGNSFRNDFSIEQERDNSAGDVQGGSVWFYALGKFVGLPGKWASLSIGYYVALEPKPSYGMYADFDWNGSSKIDWEDRAAYKEFSKFPDEAGAQQYLRTALKQAKARTIKSTVSPYRQIFRSLEIP